MKEGTCHEKCVLKDVYPNLW